MGGGDGGMGKRPTKVDHSGWEVRSPRVRLNAASEVPSVAAHTSHRSQYVPERRVHRNALSRGERCDVVAPNRCTPSTNVADMFQTGFRVLRTACKVEKSVPGLVWTMWGCRSWCGEPQCSRRVVETKLGKSESNGKT